jgi:hypothetical protein
VEPSAQGNNDMSIERLSAEHRAMKLRVRELSKRVALTSAERTEYHQLKKMKLRTKDRIRWLQAAHP